MKNFTAYEYKEITVCSDKASLYLDCYESFGWKQDENFPLQESGDKVTLKLKRDRRLVNKVELTRLQRNFEADLEDSANVYADPGLLELVWTNLLSNAIKFTPEGGAVTLRQWTGADRILVSVEDTGCGMTPETIRHIYDKFYQGDSSHATQGNGLGLALVRRVLELSDGSITVESRLGKGSVFTVALPCALQNAPEEHAWIR